MASQNHIQLGQFFTWAIATLLVVFVWFAYSQYVSSRKSFEESSLELSNSISLAEQIKKLRTKPDRATRSSHSERALAQAIEQTASNAGIAAQQIARIEPQTPRRSGDTPYMEHATVVQLESVSLVKLAMLAAGLRGLDASLGQLHITAMRVDAPYQQTKAGKAVEDWNIELILTYFVYSPKSSASRAS